jgi:DMSO reductase anchor subunit
VTGALSNVFDQISVHPQLVIVVPALMILGSALKRTPNVQDWMIIWILLGAGIIASIFTLGFSVAALQMDLLRQVQQLQLIRHINNQ